MQEYYTEIKTDTIVIALNIKKKLVFIVDVNFISSYFKIRQKIEIVKSLISKKLEKMKYELYEKQMKEYFEKMEKLYFPNRIKR